MATGSQATRHPARDKAGYLTGQRQSMPRCDACVFSAPPSATAQHTQHDLTCNRHHTGVKTHGVCVFWNGSPKATASPRPLGLPAQLQINQTGAWRSALDFDLSDTPDELLDAADTLARLSGSTGIKMQVVRSTRNDSGSMRPTRNVLLEWTRAKGWVKA